MDGVISEWSDVLKGLGSNEIKGGLEAMDGDWPPNAYEFRKLCRPDNHWQQRSAAYRPAEFDDTRVIGGRMKPKAEVLKGLRDLIEGLK